MIHWETGKYAFFVWPAYAVTGLVFAVLILDSLLRTRRWRRAAEAARPDAPQ